VTSPAESARRKIQLRLIPLFVLYITCFLDRVNVGFAALSMNADLGLSATAYGFGAGILFAGYALFEVPSNIVLARVGARRWIARIAITWGLLSACMMFVRGPTSLYVLRFFIGVAEAGFFPGIVYYLSHWFTARDRARAVALFTTGIPISAVIGGPLSGALLGLKGVGGLAGWQWLFLIEGLPAVVLGVGALWYLTDTPQQAKWLTQEERDYLTSTLRTEQAQNADRHGLSLRRALTHPVVWQLAFMYALASAGTYGLALWLPQIVKGMSGATNFQVGLLTALPNLAAAIGMVLIGMYSDKGGDRCVHVAWCGVAGGVGFLASAYLDSPALSLAALAVAAIGVNGRYGPFWTLPSRFLSGEAAAGGIALINSLGASAGFFAPYAIGYVKDLTGGFRGGLVMLSALLFLSAIIALRMRRQQLFAAT
jgi:ACS family tartrate transporter-like MFS transporter